MEEKEPINIDTPSTNRELNNSIRGGAYLTIRKILIGFILISIFNGIFSYFFYTPKIYNINNRNSELLVKYELLQSKIAAAENKLSEIKHRDNKVYRSLFGVDTMTLAGTYAPYSESKYTSLQQNPYSPLMVSTWKSLDALAKSLYRNSISLDELQILAKNKENLSTAIPAIWPIDRTKLKSVGYYGMRLHPIYKRYIFHKGIDLGAKIGTPVYATGDAVVQEIERSRYSGYGLQILLNHEFGYKTRYAHLSKILVEEGDSVKRGQLIGEVGNTGRSTGSHLHYEVLYKNNVVNPINYFDRNMTNEEYVKLMEELKVEEYEIFEEH